MTFDYSIYGIACRSNVALSGISAPAAGAAPEIRFHFKRMPELRNAAWRTYYTSDELDVQGRVRLEVSSCGVAGLYRFRYGDGTTIVINNDATDIWAEWPAPLTLEDTLTYLLGPVMGFVIRLRGGICLHASVVAIDDHAVGFLAPAGGGKSTLAARLAKQGFAVISDDALVLSERDSTFLAFPGYPRLRLWPDSVASLFGAPDALPLLTPNWEKRFMELDNGHFLFCDHPLPLGAIYYVGEADENAGRALVRPASTQNALMALIGNSSQNLLLDTTMRRREFEILGELVSRTPVHEISPRSPEQFLSDFDEQILLDFRSMGQPARV